MRDVVPILRKLHNLETMAVEIYRVQIPRLTDPEERKLMVAAMDNEMLHRETFRSLLVKHSATLSPLRYAWWFVGQVLGLSTALLGRGMLFRGDMAFEEKAVREYSEIAAMEGFDAEEAGFLDRFLEDEKRHVAHWKFCLGHPHKQ